MRDDLDEIKFGEKEFYTEYNGQHYIVTSKGGSFFGRAFMIDNICIRFEIVYSKGEFTYEVIENGDRVELISYDESELIKVLDNRMWQYLENTEVENAKLEVA